MARLARLTLPHHLHHVLHRGHGGQHVFSRSADFERFLQILTVYAGQFEVAIHAYALMSDHVHLIATPQQDNNGVSRMMQAVGRSYGRYFNDLNGRSGTLWEGRYRSTLIQAERWGLACMVWGDLSPVRSGLVVDAASYAWSSHAHYVGRRVDALITPHAVAWALANTPFAREAAYAELVRRGLDASVQSALSRSVVTGWVLGDESFTNEVQKKTSRRVVQARVGRPAISRSSSKSP
jgi:putative transposase